MLRKVVKAVRWKASGCTLRHSQEQHLIAPFPRGGILDFAF